MGYSANTAIQLLDGRSITFAALVSTRRQKGTGLDLKTGQVEAADLMIPRVCGNYETMRLVKLVHGEFAATGDQKVLLEDGTKIEVAKLQPGMRLKGIQRPNMDPNSYVVNHIQFETERGDSHSVTVPRYGNFALSCGVFVCD